MHGSRKCFSALYTEEYTALLVFFKEENTTQKKILLTVFLLTDACTLNRRVFLHSTANTFF